MGNAITNPGRFIEKKIMHEQFGVPDPKFSNKLPPGVVQQPCGDDWKQRQDRASQNCVFDGLNLGSPGVNDVTVAKCQGKVNAGFSHCKK